MLKKGLITVLIISISILTLSCAAEKPEEVALDGAFVDFGRQVDEDNNLLAEEGNFKAGEIFYFYFNNNRPFGADRVTVQLVAGDGKKVLAEHTYEVEPGEFHLIDRIYYDQAGEYFVTVRIDGLVRVSRLVSIE